MNNQQLKTASEIRRKYYLSPGSYEVKTCLAYYRELHENKCFKEVEFFLIKGDRVLGQQGFTWTNALKEFTTVESNDFNDARGEYAGTFYSYFYNGVKVYESTSYSLFN